MKETTRIPDSKESYLQSDRNQEAEIVGHESVSQKCLKKQLALKLVQEDNCLHRYTIRRNAQEQEKSRNTPAQSLHIHNQLGHAHGLKELNMCSVDSRGDAAKALLLELPACGPSSSLPLPPARPSLDVGVLVELAALLSAPLLLDSVVGSSCRRSPSCSPSARSLRVPASPATRQGTTVGAPLATGSRPAEGGSLGSGRGLCWLAGAQMPKALWRVSKNCVAEATASCSCKQGQGRRVGKGVQGQGPLHSGGDGGAHSGIRKDR